MDLKETVEHLGKRDGSLEPDADALRVSLVALSSLKGENWGHVFLPVRHIDIFALVLDLEIQITNSLADVLKPDLNYNLGVAFRVFYSVLDKVEHNQARQVRVKVQFLSHTEVDPRFYLQFDCFLGDIKAERPNKVI